MADLSRRTCIISVVRLVYVVHLDLTDFTWNVVDFIIWTCLELWWYVASAWTSTSGLTHLARSAIICACLPSLGPLFRIGRDKFRTFHHPRNASCNGPSNLNLRAWPAQLKPSNVSPMRAGSFTRLPSASHDGQNSASGWTEPKAPTQAHLKDIGLMDACSE